MFDREIAHDLFAQIREACDRIERRFEGIETPEDFLENEDSQTRLDAIGMMLITIGENLKRLDKYVPAETFEAEPGIDWKRAKGMRDVLSHGYWTLEIETVFNVCRDRIPELREAMLRMMDRLNDHGSTDEETR
jgi:uncharacterized protein with HEPN domain